MSRAVIILALWAGYSVWLDLSHRKVHWKIFPQWSTKSKWHLANCTLQIQKFNLNISPFFRRPAFSYVHSPRQVIERLFQKGCFFRRPHHSVTFSKHAECCSKSQTLSKQTEYHNIIHTLPKYMHIESFILNFDQSWLNYKYSSLYLTVEESLA
jgi:hypothetical protein